MKDAKNRIMKKEQGITLIALVVTIVVLLILAGITISTLFGDNGIITAARKAAEETKKGEEDTEKGLENLINDMELATWTPTDPKYFTYTLDESTKTATITGVKEEYGLKRYYKENSYITAVKTEKGEYITDIVIPDKANIEGKEYTITAIEDLSFAAQWSETIEKGYTSFKIPPTITKIGNNAFYYCRSLTNITIPNSVTSIGENAFYMCTGITNITIPNSVTTIGESAFYMCTGLTNITIPNSVTSIGKHAFYMCTGLTNITIPNSVTSIGENAFYMCTGITNITIPNSVTSIAKEAFFYCTGLKNIAIPSSVTTMGSYVFGNISSITVTVPFTEGNKPSGWDSNWNRSYTGRVTVQYKQ